MMKIFLTTLILSGLCNCENVSRENCLEELLEKKICLLKSNNRMLPSPPTFPLQVFVDILLMVN